MPSTPANLPVRKFLMRYYVELLGVLSVLFVLQTGLVPFDFFTGAPHPGARVLFTAATDHYTLPDIIGNIFLYVPIGLLAHTCICRRGVGSVGAWLLALAAAAALSGGIEWLQAYSPARVSSLIDLVANIIGAGIGATISMTARWLLPKITGAVLLEFHTHPHAAFIKAYCVMLLLGAAMPFSFALDFGRFKQAVKTARAIPFAATTEHQAVADQALAAGNYHAYSMARWHVMKRWSRWTVECLSFAVLAVLLQSLLSRHYGFGNRSVIALTCWLCAMFAIGLSMMQFFVVTRGFDVTDILFRWFGVALGLVASRSYRQTKQRWTDDASQRQAQMGRRIGWVGCCSAFIYILYSGLIPLTFTTSDGGPAAAIQDTGFLPFFAYFVTRFDLMMDDAMEKFAAYALFAAFLSVCWTRIAGRPTWRRVFAVAGVTVTLSAMIEVAQAYIPVRVTSLTDPILALAGCLAGVVGCDQAIAFYRYAVTHEMMGHDGRRADYELPVPLAPSDALIATLTEPYDGAPVEEVPSPTPKPRPTIRD